MKKRVLITTIISFLLLAAVIAAGVNAVFTVTLVKTDFSVFSEEGEREAETLKAEIDKFVGSSTTFLDLDEVRGVVDGYPCMRVDRIEKKYPSTVEIDISERREAFAARTENGYAILSDDGTYLYEKPTSLSRTGGENILIDGFDFAPSEKGMDEAFSAFLKIYAVFEEVLSAPRANVVAVHYEPRLVYDFVTITMREGISIEIVSPKELSEEKARAALTHEKYGYLVRSDAERLSGTITVAARGEEIQVDYDFDHAFRDNV